MTIVEWNSSPRLTIVMYHYVRRLAASRFPRLPALDLDAFRGQLDFIRRHYKPISISDVVSAASRNAKVPIGAMVLTFDDGYAEHYREVFPLLRQAGIPATFFPAASALIERRLLDVNKIQFILAAAETADTLVASIDEAVEGASSRTDVRPVTDYRAEAWKPVRFDSPAASYVKYMLQGGLPEDFRTRLLDELFAKFVSADQRAFAEELYMTVDQAREIREAGMTIGAHADRHVTLTLLSRDDQAHEIDGALRVLDAVGAARSGFAFSYAKGAYDEDSIALLRDRACAIAVTNRRGNAMVGPDTLLTLPRFDAKHLPTDPDAAPTEWTSRV